MGFLRSVMILVGGTALGHGITALSMPLLTRVYSPQDFSVLATFSGLLAILAVSAGLRFDVAVSMPESSAESLNLLALALLSAGGVSLLLLCVIVAAPERLAGLLGQPALASYLWLLPIGVFLACAYSALQFWYVRASQFTLLARSRVAQSTASAGTQLGMGVLGAAPVGLLVGHVMNSGAACLILGPRLLADRSAGALRQVVDRRSLAAAFRAYDRYPKFATLEALVANAAISLPILMIAAMAAGPEAGYLALAISVMQAPMALVGVSIGQVYLSRATGEFREGRLGAFTAQTVGGLLRTGLGPLLAAGIVAPYAFGLIFGEGWERAGWLVAWMTPWYVMQFLASPISMALYVTGHQRTLLGLQLFALVLRVGSVWLADLLWPARLAEAYALSGLLFYAVYLATTLRVAGSRWADLLQASRRAIPWAAGWMLAALAAVLLLRRLQL